MELVDVGRILWRRRLAVLVVLVATVAIGAAFALSTPKKYESTATLAFTPNAEQGNATAISPVEVASLLQTYAVTAKSDVIIRRAEIEQGHRLFGTITASPRLETGILVIGDRASSPQSAADAVAAVSLAFIRSLKGNSLVYVQVVDPPTADTTAVQPRPKLVVGVALILGLAAGCMLALVLDHFRRRVDSSAEVAEVVDLPVLGHVPYKRAISRLKGEAAVWDAPRLAAVQESMRALRTNLHLMGTGAPRSLLVTSATSGEGKTTLVANLGIALSLAGIPTVILDADMRSPRQHEIFGLENSDGLSVALEEGAANQGTRSIRPQPTTHAHLTVLTAGPPRPMSTELMYTQLRPILAELQGLGSLVLIDSPALLPVADARFIASEVDATIVVVNARRERPATLHSAVEKLRLAGASVAGVVLNQTSGAEAARKLRRADTNAAGVALSPEADLELSSHGVRDDGGVRSG